MSPISIVDDEDKVIKNYETAEEFFYDMNKDFEREHKFYNWFNKFYEKRTGIDNILGYSPHMIFDSPISILHQIRDEIKWAYQRVFRGWDDRASWGIGYWLNDIMPDILRMALEKGQGIPITFFDKEPDLQDGNYSRPQELKAEIRMRNTYLDLISAFKEMKELEDYQFDWKNKTQKQNLKEYSDKMKSAKKKLRLLIDYYWELGD